MNLLNQKMLFENINEFDTNKNNQTTDKMVIAPVSNDTIKNNIIDKSNPSQIHCNNCLYSLTGKYINKLDEIESRMIVDDMYGFDTIVECMMELTRDLENISIIMENGVSKTHAAQYNILSESSDNDKVIALYESAIGTLWQTFITALKKFIIKARNLINEFTFRAVANFDYYGKWASTFEESLNNANKSTSNGKKIYINTYDWKRENIFQMTDFSRLHEYASTIIGKATTVEDMEKKLQIYENNKFTSDDVYNYIISKCCGVSIGNIKGDKSEIHDKIISKLRGKEINIEVTSDKVNQCLKDLKSIKSHVIRYANRSRLSIMNPQFDIMLKDAERELNENRSDTDNIKYKYFRVRYDVFSKAQQVAFDIYHIKIRLIKDYAESCKAICKAYVSEPINESIDYLSMNKDIASNSIVLD